MRDCASVRYSRRPKDSREIGMKTIRMKVTVHLNRNHALSIQGLNALKPLVERGIAASLPDSIAVDTIRVTKIKEIDVLSEPDSFSGEGSDKEKGAQKSAGKARGRLSSAA